MGNELKGVRIALLTTQHIRQGCNCNLLPAQVFLELSIAQCKTSSDVLTTLISAENLCRQQLVVLHTPCHMEFMTQFYAGAEQSSSSTQYIIVRLIG